MDLHTVQRKFTVFSRLQQRDRTTRQYQPSRIGACLIQNVLHKNAKGEQGSLLVLSNTCLLYTSQSNRTDRRTFEYAD